MGVFRVFSVREWATGHTFWSRNNLLAYENLRQETLRPERSSAARRCACTCKFFFSHGPNFRIYSELKQNRKNILYSDIDSVQFFYSETEIRKNNNHSKWILTKTRQKGPHEKNNTFTVYVFITLFFHLINRHLLFIFFTM